MSLFTEQELERIRQAVGAAERRTSGEIVPFVINRSGRYEVALWRGAAIGVGLALIVLMLVYQFYTGWGLGWMHEGWGVALLVTLSGLVGALLTQFVAPLRRILAGADRLTQRVHHRAMRAFVEEEVFKTINRTGILLFVSLFEHRIEVLGDAGINQKVTPEEWVDVIERIRRGIQQGHLADGLIEAIEMCGHLLETKGVALLPDDTDELPDGLRLRKE